MVKQAFGIAMLLVELNNFENIVPSGFRLLVVCGECSHGWGAIEKLYYIKTKLANEYFVNR